MNDTQRSGSVIGGLVLLGLGLVFLVQNLTGLDLGHWWALFLLVPGAATLFRGYGFFQTDHGLSSRATGALLGGGVLTLLGAAFLFSLNLSGIWPLFLMLTGVTLLLRPQKSRN